MGTDYFMKWVEVVSTRHITQDNVCKFIWKKIFTRFGIRHTLVTDNGQQFKDNKIKKKYASYLIKHALSTPNYVKSNGQAELSNKATLKKLHQKVQCPKRLMG